jgi:hypothetical protein
VSPLPPPFVYSQARLIPVDISFRCVRDQVGKSYRLGSTRRCSLSQRMLPPYTMKERQRVVEQTCRSDFLISDSPSHHLLPRSRYNASHDQTQCNPRKTPVPIGYPRTRRLSFLRLLLDRMSVYRDIESSVSCLCPEYQTRSFGPERYTDFRIS